MKVILRPSCVSALSFRLLEMHFKLHASRRKLSASRLLGEPSGDLGINLFFGENSPLPDVLLRSLEPLSESQPVENLLDLYSLWKVFDKLGELRFGNPHIRSPQSTRIITPRT